MDLVIQKLVSNGLLYHVPKESIEYLSPIYITPIAGGGHRLILKLKHLNEAVTYRHFKMEASKQRCN